MRRNMRCKESSAESIRRESGTGSATVRGCSGSSGDRVLSDNRSADVVAHDSLVPDSDRTPEPESAQLTDENHRLRVLKALLKINAAANRQLNRLSTATGMTRTCRRRLTAELRSVVAQVNVHLFELIRMPPDCSLGAMRASVYALEARINDVRSRAMDTSQSQSQSQSQSSPARSGYCCRAVSAAICKWFSNIVTCFQFHSQVR